MDESKYSLIFLYLANIILIIGINFVVLDKFENFLKNFDRDYHKIIS